ncbi:hypothetical protein ED28_13185 [[Pantoea] beijingensis]|uniref:DEAD/DEAH box helicase n=1 Tax=[Pantoea] beijingensis TaxID=1324864 RepID=A0A443IBC2_9GAMM|nr:DEAD/DEAH box helicase [[Pantoea] beijingensis]RWR01442.1 hypothetical protein ED28_13185 [[Pantoea] beijingensis]
MTFTFHHNDEIISLNIAEEKQSLISRLFKRQQSVTLSGLAHDDRTLAFAIADLKALAEEFEEPLHMSHDAIVMSHRLAGRLDSETAQTLGLPSLVDLTLKTDIEGALGSDTFRLHHEWLRNGVRQLPSRRGSILKTSQGLRRLPLWMMEAVDVAENFTPGGGEASDWESLARFRQALDPGVQMGSEINAVRVSMTDFMQGLEVRIADRFSISTSANGADDFEIVPFSARNVEELENSGETVSEAIGELSDQRLRRFQQRVRTQGALSAYRVGEGNYLVIDRSARPILDVMVEKQKSPPEERRAFIENPRPAITDAVEQYLRQSGKLDGLDDVGEEEAIEAAAGPAFIETVEYSERVKGILHYQKGAASAPLTSEMDWLPEIIPDALTKIIDAMDAHALASVCQQMREAIDSSNENIEVASHSIKATEDTLRALEKRLANLKEMEETAEITEKEVDPEVSTAPFATVILDTKDNFEVLSWQPERKARTVFIDEQLPVGVKTALRLHQLESFRLQLSSWKSGMPGILNADEQGLGKTLQTIAFLRWLKENNTISTSSNKERGPILIVAPTSLLENWSAEVEQHTDEEGLGWLLRLYGSSLSQYKNLDAKGVETKDGNVLLNFKKLNKAINEGKGHRFWILTTYTTLTNYQHSFAKIHFSAVVFDEIQAIKNPDSLRAHAARAINADYRMGLTGTPIENTTADLWAVMDQLAPGALDTQRNFNRLYSEPDEQNMLQLYQHVFEPRNQLPPLAFRRLKENVAKELPAKIRFLHPRLMPEGQAIAYETARLKLSQGGAGAALKMLQHIRGVSVHPAMEMHGDNQRFIDASARLNACFEILRRIKSKGERALIFIEHRKMQFRFMELARQEFSLEKIDHINGDTPIKKRQEIVKKFQRHLAQDEGFDLLVLGPKAAGTGLTLTAATHVIHLSRWWNPAVEEQCNDRVHRIGQKYPVHIHMPMAIHAGYQEHSFDCLLQGLMSRKRNLARAALWPLGDSTGDLSQLQAALKKDKSESVGDVLDISIRMMFERDAETDGVKMEDGAYRIS